MNKALGNPEREQLVMALKRRVSSAEVQTCREKTKKRSSKGTQQQREAGRISVYKKPWDPRERFAFEVRET